MHYRDLILALATVSLLVTPMAAARAVMRPPPPPDPGLPATRPTPPHSSSVWEPLVASGGRWVLYPGAGKNGTRLPGRIEVESYDPRVVKGAKVARLRWTYIENERRSPLTSSLPGQLAVTRRGVWILTERADDKQIAEALKHKPDMADPPRPHKDVDGYVRTDGAKVCIGVGTPPGAATRCDLGVCHSEYCLLPGVGVASVAGNYAPAGVEFSAPNGSRPGALDPTGIDACDAFLQRAWSCVAGGHLPPAAAELMRRDLPVWTDEFREVAAARGPAAAAARCAGMNSGEDQLFKRAGC
jgi:hypothetical protein